MKSQSSRKIFSFVIATILLWGMTVEGQTLGVRLWTDKNSNPAIQSSDSQIVRYTEGDFFRVYVRATKPCYVRVLYQDAAGYTLQLFPNIMDTSDYIQEERTYQLPTLFEVRPPFGEEELICLQALRSFPTSGSEKETTASWWSMIRPRCS
jgi:hypothetical protein